jgi:hypothetical protein
VTKLAEQQTVEKARAEEAARARDERIKDLEEGLRASEKMRSTGEVRQRRK